MYIYIYIHISVAYTYIYIYVAYVFTYNGIMHRTNNIKYVHMWDNTSHIISM